MYHFIDNWDGNKREFPTLAKAIKAAKEITGVSVAIYKGRELVKIAKASGHCPA